MAGRRWYFSKEQLENTPSRKCGIDADKELSYRQQAANFIQDMGQRLQVTQLCINTAIVYMHRFYLFHSFTKFHRNAISTCSLFLAAKVEEQPRKLEHVIKIAHICLHRETVPFDVKSDSYLEQSHELIANENIMLQTLGFDIGIDHPHTYVVKCCQLVRASKDLAQTSYIMATNSLHLTTMSLQYPPTVVACVCIHLACKWSNWELPTSTEGKEWYWYVDQTVTKPLLEELTSEFLAILEKCPSRLKRKISAGKQQESEPREKRKLEVPLASPSSGSRSHEKELQPPDKRMRLEVPVAAPSSLGPNHEKSHSHQEDRRLLTANRRLKSVPSPVTSKETQQPPHPKSSATHNIPASSLAKLPVHTSEEIPSKRLKEGSHSITIADYKEKQEQKAKEQIKITGFNPPHPVPTTSKKPGKEERKPEHHQNPNDKDNLKRKMVHQKHTEDNLMTNSEQQPIDQTANTVEENLQQKVVDEARQALGNRAVNSRAEASVTGVWYDKGKSEPYPLKHKELPTELPTNAHSHQGKIASRPVAAVQGTLRSHHSDQNMRLKIGSESHSEHIQANVGNGEHPSQTKANKTKHQKHRTVPSVTPVSLPQDDLPGHDRNSKRIVEEGENPNISKTIDNAPIAHKFEGDHSKRVDTSVDKGSDFPSRQDRREKHKHKHSSHGSDREKASVGAEHVPLSSLSGGIKITIPKEKLCVSSTQRTNSGNSPRGRLKLKINKGKLASSDVSKSSSTNSSNANRNFKLVIAKDKKQRNTYSCTSYAYSPQKSDCDEHKREKSPSDGCHGVSTEQLNVNRSPKVKYEHALSMRKGNSTHSNDESQIPLPPETNVVQHTNAVNHSQQIMTAAMPMGYHQQKPIHQGYVQYNHPQYYSQYFQCPPPHLSANVARLPHMFNNPRMPPPPFLPDEPPLPKEPPPLPPPLPPE